MHWFLKFIFGIKLHVSDSFSVHHQEFFSVHTVMVYVVQVCWQLESRIRAELVPSRSCSQAVNKTVCTVKNSWWWTEKPSETCTILFQKKFEKWMHVVGFIIRIFHSARSPERQSHCIDPLITNFGGRWIWLVNIPFHPLYPREITSLFTK